MSDVVRGREFRLAAIWALDRSEEMSDPNPAFVNTQCAVDLVGFRND